MHFTIKLVPIHIKKYVIFKIVVFKVLSKGNSIFFEKIGFYNTDPVCKAISVNTYRLGYWLNKGAKINFSIYKILKKFLARSSN